MAREKIKVGEYEFNTKKELREFTKHMMQKLFKKEILGDHPFLFELIKRHPEPNEQYISNVSFFKAYPNPITKDTSSPHVVVVKNNGDEIAFSWNACVTSLPYGGSRILNAMRTAVSDDILEFKFSQPQECMTCGSDDKLDVDHVETFSSIAKDFLERVPKHPTKFGKNHQSRDIFTKDDEWFEASWVEFHLQKSTLQLLCKKCHKEKTSSQRYKNAVSGSTETLV